MKESLSLEAVFRTESVLSLFKETNRGYMNEVMAPRRALEDHQLEICLGPFSALSLLSFAVSLVSLCNTMFFVFLSFLALVLCSPINGVARYNFYFYYMEMLDHSILVSGSFLLTYHLIPRGKNHLNIAHCFC